MPANQTVELAVHVPPGYAVETDNLSLEADPVLTALDQAAAAHRDARAETERLAAEAELALQAVEQARVAERAARAELGQLRGEVHAERARADRQTDRADKLLHALREVHKTLFGGNVFEAILRASMSLTGATRGVYVSAFEGSSLQVRAAVGVDGYPGKAPSGLPRRARQTRVRDQRDVRLQRRRGVRRVPRARRRGRALPRLPRRPRGTPGAAQRRRHPRREGGRVRRPTTAKRS